MGWDSLHTGLSHVSIPLNVESADKSGDAENMQRDGVYKRKDTDEGKSQYCI